MSTYRLCPVRIASFLLVVVAVAGCGNEPWPPPGAGPGTVKPGAGAAVDAGTPPAADAAAPPPTPTPLPDAATPAPPLDARAADASPAPTDRGNAPPPPADAGPTAPPPPPPACAPVPRCDTAPPDPGARRPWRGTFTGVLAGTGPRHRGRDQFVAPGAPQWLIARFAYGLLDGALNDEDVDVYLLRNCGPTWEKLATVRTTGGSGAMAHPAQEGVEDNGGRVFFQIPADKALGPGRHRARFVVGGDLTTTELFIEVVPAGTPMFVTDVDGTLTTSETAEFGALLTGALPDANADAATALTRLADKGYRPMYLTARPEWLVDRTREFLAREGFPPGIVHTTLGGTGAMGTAAITFKTGELAMLAGKGLRPTYAFGNTDTDAQAYENGAIEPADRRVFFRYTDAMHMGRRIEAYKDLVPELTALSPACR